MDELLSYLDRDGLLLSNASNVYPLVELIKEYYPNHLLYRDISFETLFEELNKRAPRAGKLNDLLNGNRLTLIIDLVDIWSDEKETSFPHQSYNILCDVLSDLMCVDNLHVLVINTTYPAVNGDGQKHNQSTGGSRLLYSFPLVLGFHDTISVIKDREAPVKDIISDSMKLLRGFKLKDILK